MYSPRETQTADKLVHGGSALTLILLAVNCRSTGNLSPVTEAVEAVRQYLGRQCE